VTQELPTPPAHSPARHSMQQPVDVWADARERSLNAGKHKYEVRQQHGIAPCPIVPLPEQQAVLHHTMLAIPNPTHLLPSSCTISSSSSTLPTHTQHSLFPHIRRCGSDCIHHAAKLSPASPPRPGGGGPPPPPGPHTHLLPSSCTMSSSSSTFPVTVGAQAP
jgi:hypothetical protein